MTTNRICPECNKPLIKRIGKRGPFMACTGYPACRHTESIKYENVEPVKVYKPLGKTFKPSSYQQAIYDQFVDSADNILVNATAGSGKTTLLVWLSEFIPQHTSARFLAFNKKIATELASRLPSSVQAGTLHQMGFRILASHVNHKITVDNYKVKTYLQKIVADDKPRKANIAPACMLVSKWKNTHVTTALTDDQLYELCDRFNIDLRDQASDIFMLARWGIDCSVNVLNVIDFDDMLFVPAVKGWKSEPVDLLMVDECQDLNPVQQALLALLDVKRFVFVGDRFQSIYAFRGADSKAMDNIASNFNCIGLPLSLSYRNSKAIVTWVNSCFPEITHECLPDAPEGEVSTIDDELFMSEVTSNDLVLCRNNAPLLSKVYKHWQKGQKAHVQGRDIGEGLIALIGKLDADDIDDLIDKTEQWAIGMIERYNKQGRAEQAENITDQRDCIIELANEHESISSLVHSLSHLFADSLEDSITYSTVHRSKGLECENAYILKPALLTKHDDEQSRFVRFVAYTRAKHGLYFIGDTMPSA